MLGHDLGILHGLSHLILPKIYELYSVMIMSSFFQMRKVRSKEVKMGGGDGWGGGEWRQLYLNNNKKKAKRLN